MSIRSLCDHRVIVYRATEGRDEFKDVTRAWAPLEAPDGKNARPNQLWAGSQMDPGPGEVQGAMRGWFLVAEFDVQERDVLRVIAGPEAPALLMVESVTRPTDSMNVHHLEVNVRTWTGSLE